MKRRGLVPHNPTKARPLQAAGTGQEGPGPPLRGAYGQSGP